MDIVRKYLLSSACWSPDEPAAAEAPIVEAPAPEPEPAAAAAEPAPEPEAAAPEPEPAPAPRASPMVPLRVLQERVGEVSTRAREFEGRAAEAERRNAEYEQIIQRLQRPADPAAPAPAPAPATPRTERPQDFDTAVRTEAARVRFFEDTGAVKNAGLREFGASFEQTLGILSAVGATSDDVVSDLIAIDKDNAHRILADLAKDEASITQAAALAAMDPRRRIAELTRMADKLAAPAPKPAGDPAPAAPAKPAISRAPAPKPNITPHAPAPEVDPTTPDGNEKMSDVQFERWYKDKYQKRSA